MINRRVVANLFVEPWALIRLSIPFFAMIAAAAGIVVVIYLELVKAVDRAQLESNNHAAIAALQEVVRQVTVLGAVGLGVLGIVCFGFWIVYSHRIFGPVVSIRRQIHRMTDGDYKTRLKLRPSDEFNNIADDLNRLAEALEKKAK